MSKIREVTISGNEYFLDTIIGYDGEHKITNLNIKLPSELISDDIDHYTVEFQTQNGDVISSGNIQQNGGYVVVSPWQDVMVFGQLKFQVTAWAMTGDTIDKIAKSPVITRLVGESVDGDAVLLDENVGGLMVELQQLIANYPVMMGTFTAGEEWDFELVDGLLNIVYVPATDGEDGLNGITPEIGENGNWFIDGVDTGILADVSLIDLSGYELKSNKVTSIDSNSTDEQYASAKLIYTELLSKLSAEYPEVPTQSNFLRDDGVFAEVHETVEKFSNLPENGTIALVQNDEVVPKEQSDLDADTEYTLFVNPQPSINTEFNETITPSETSEFDNNKIDVSANLTDFSAPVFLIFGEITDGENTTKKMWVYTENGATSFASDDMPTLTLLAGWSYVEVLNGALLTNEAVKYLALPDLEGTFETSNALGGTYLSELPYNLNKAGIYYYNEDVATWVRNNKDSSLWCEEIGLASAALGGYGNSTPGNASAALGGSGNSTPGDGSAALGGSGNSTPGDLSAALGGYRNSTPGVLSVALGGSDNSTPGNASAALGGYENSTPGDYSAALGGSGNSTPGDRSVALGGSGNSTPGDLSAALGGYENSTPGYGSVALGGHGLIASQENAAIVGQYGETPEDSLFAVANGTSISNKSLALNIKPDEAVFTIPVLGVTADALDSSTKLATTAFVQGEIAGAVVEVKANKVTTIDANSTDEEYPSAKAVFDFVPEIDVDELVPTMTEYATVLTLNKGNYWTTTASIEFGLPTPVAGKVNTFDLDLTVANAAHAITWSAAVEWAGAVAHVFGAGHHIVSGQYSPVSSKWVLVGSAVGVTA